MLDIGWQELLVVGVLALLVVGPKELPGLLRTLGQFAGKARSVAREFQRSMDEAAREADVAEFKKLADAKREIEKIGKVDFSEQAKRVNDSLTSGGKPKPAEPAKPAETAAPAEPKAAEAASTSALAPATPAPEPAADPAPADPAKS